MAHRHVNFGRWLSHPEPNKESHVLPEYLWLRRWSRTKESVQNSRRMPVLGL